MGTGRFRSMRRRHSCAYTRWCCASTHAEAASLAQSPAKAGYSSKRTLSRTCARSTLLPGRRREVAQARRVAYVIVQTR